MHDDGLPDHPRCAHCGVLLREDHAGYTCPVCGEHIADLPVIMPDVGGMGSIGGG